MTEKQYKNDIVKKMKAVNTYNKSFDHVINVLAKTMSEYEMASEKFEQSGGSIVIRHTNKNGSTNIVKNPFYLAIEKLRDDILAYSKELGLTPAGLNKINNELEKKSSKSKLFEALSNIQ